MSASFFILGIVAAVLYAAVIMAIENQKYETLWYIVGGIIVFFFPACLIFTLFWVFAGYRTEKLKFKGKVGEFAKKNFPTKKPSKS